MVCTLAAETNDDEYLAMIERHNRGKQRRRGADLMAEVFGELINALTETDADSLRFVSGSGLRGISPWYPPRGSVFGMHHGKVDSSVSAASSRFID
jgi:hypothetical protein